MSNKKLNIPFLLLDVGNSTIYVAEYLSGATDRYGLGKFSNKLKIETEKFGEYLKKANLEQYRKVIVSSVVRVGCN